MQFNNYSREEFTEHEIIPETSQVLTQIRNLWLMDEPRLTVTKYQSMEKQSWKFVMV